MARLEFELRLSDAVNPGFGGVAEFKADGERAMYRVLTRDQYHYLLGAIARELTDLTDGERGR